MSPGRHHNPRVYSVRGDDSGGTFGVTVLLNDARENLFSVARSFAETPLDTLAQRALCEAAAVYQQARLNAASGATAAGNAPPLGSNDSSDFVVRFGRSKGKRISECDTADLQWLAGAMQRSIDDPEKQRFAEQNRSDLAAILAQLNTRNV